MCDGPEDGAVAHAVGQALAECAIQESRCDAEKRWFCGQLRKDAVTKRRATLVEQRVQLGFDTGRNGAHRLGETHVDLGLVEHPVRRREQRFADVEVVVGKLEIEEGRFRLLELGCCRQDVIGRLRRLGHGDVDDDGAVEGAHRFAPARAVGQ